MEKVEMVREMMSKGIKRDESLLQSGLTRNQFYYKVKGNRRGRLKTETTKWRDPQTMKIYEVDNEQVTREIVDIKLDPDHPNWYKLITNTIQIRGYYINHKKVYRLMFEGLLLDDKPKITGRNFVKFRKVAPIGALQIIEMDIKYVYIEGTGKQGFVFTILDTFTRCVLHWTIGYSMKSEQIKRAWEYVIAEYYQPLGINHKETIIEIRSDNGRQFVSTMIREFFEINGMTNVYTHPYTPEENGHIESFHSILGKSLSKDIFNDLTELERRLIKFYTCYNNDRSHSGVKGIPPTKFWALFDLGYIEVVPLKLNQLRIKLKVAYQDILTLPDINKYKYRVIQLP